MIHKQIEKLIPFIEEEFITYPMWEEGKYIPFVNFWQKFELEYDAQEFEKKLNSFITLGYDFHNAINFKSKIHHCQIYPDYKELDDGSYEFVNENWSIEEMLEIIVSLVS